MLKVSPQNVCFLIVLPLDEWMAALCTAVLNRVRPDRLPDQAYLFRQGLRRVTYACRTLATGNRGGHADGQAHRRQATNTDRAVSSSASPFHSCARRVDPRRPAVGAAAYGRASEAGGGLWAPARFRPSAEIAFPAVLAARSCLHRGTPRYRSLPHRLDSTCRRGQAC